MIQLHWPVVLRQAFFNVGIKFEEDKSLLKIATLRKLFKELDEIIIGVEAEGLDFYSDPEMVDGEDSSNIVKYLLYDIALDRSQITWENFRKLFLKQDRMLLSELREEFQKVFVLLHKQIKNGSKHEDVIVEMLLGNLLSFYAFTEPVAGDLLSVPQKQDGEWRLVDYEVELMELTPHWLGEPMIAIGLKPKTEMCNPSILLFRGTPLPGAKAWHLAELTDFTPGCSLGGLIYYFGKDKIAKWIGSEDRKVQIYGQSLGGALAYHTAIDHPEKVEVNNYVPPGLFPGKFNSKNSGKIPIEGKVYCHRNDIVYLIGVHPTSAKLIKVITEKPRNPYLAHLRSFGCEKVLLLRVNNEMENRRPIRTIMTLLHQLYSVPFFVIKLGVLGIILAKKKIDRRWSHGIKRHP